MIRQRLIFFIGLWIALLPFLGFPKNFRTVLFVLTGLGLIAISYFMYIQIKAVSEVNNGSRELPRKPRKKKRVVNQNSVVENLNDSANTPLVLDADLGDTSEVLLNQTSSGGEEVPDSDEKIPQL